MCRWFDRLMRTILVTTLLISGCGITRSGTWGNTRSELSGKTSLVFVNATPDKMCSVRIQKDGERSFGDNWLPPEGLPSGKSLDVKVKPGTYQATWSTCATPGKPYYAGTLTHETAFEVKESTQLFAFVADTVAPTKRAAPREFHAMVRFAGQPIGGDPQPEPVAAKPAVVAEAPKTEKNAKTTKTDMSAFVDRKAKPTGKMKASLVRKVDIADQKVGYSERTKR
jgi:hypothetical protein